MFGIAVCIAISLGIIWEMILTDALKTARSTAQKGYFNTMISYPVELTQVHRRDCISNEETEIQSESLVVCSSTHDGAYKIYKPLVQSIN